MAYYGKLNMATEPEHSSDELYNKLVNREDMVTPTDLI